MAADPAARTSGPSASGAAAKPKAPAGVNGTAYATAYTNADLDRVRAEEQVRVATVFSSEASKGRERVCATLLTSASKAKAWPCR